MYTGAKICPDSRQSKQGTGGGSYTPGLGTGDPANTADAEWLAMGDLLASERANKVVGKA